MGRAKRVFTLKNRRRMPVWLAWLLAACMKLLRRTYRLSVSDPHRLLETEEPWPVVFALWHNRILFLADCFPAHMKRRAAVLISASRDGEYASTVIRRFGLGVLRGSSSRHGFRAVREMMRKLDEGVSIVLTLDGPRGPKYTVQRGAVALAATCKVPLVPVSLNAPNRWQTRSWDQTQIPKPFSRIELSIGPPLTLEGLSDPDGNLAAERLKEALMAVTNDERSPSPKPEAPPEREPAGSHPE